MAAHPFCFTAHWSLQIRISLIIIRCPASLSVNCSGCLGSAASRHCPVIYVLSSRFLIPTAALLLHLPVWNGLFARPVVTRRVQSETVKVTCSDSGTASEDLLLESGHRTMKRLHLHKEPFTCLFKVQWSSTRYVLLSGFTMSLMLMSCYRALVNRIDGITFPNRTRLDTAPRWAVKDTNTKCEADKMNSSQAVRATYRHAEQDFWK